MIVRPITKIFMLTSEVIIMIIKKRKEWKKKRDE